MPMQIDTQDSATGVVTVVIPTYNRRADVLRALAALARQCGPPVHVIVVDNGSTDGTAEAVKGEQAAWCGRLRYLRKTPEGPASARNAGLALASTPLVLFQDSDVELPPEWTARALARLHVEPDLAAVGGRIVYEFDPARVNAYGGALNWFGLAWDIDEGQPLPSLDAEGKTAIERVWINCSAMLVRRSSATEVGGFDERFFYGFEDTDLGWRLRLAGHSLKVVPELVARHHVDVATGPAHPDIVFHACKNRLAMLLRNAQSVRLPLVLAGYLAYTAVDLVLRGPRAPKWRALKWNLLEWRNTRMLRAATQRLRRADDAAVFACGDGRWFPPSRLNGLRRRAIPREGPATTSDGVPADDRV